MHGSWSSQLFHALLNSGIVVLAVFIEHSAGEHTWGYLFILLGVFVLFLLIQAVWDRVREHRARTHDHQPIRLSAGFPHGHWVDIMRDQADNQIRGGSFLIISSTNAGGFHIDGESWEYVGDPDHRRFEHRGGFIGDGRQWNPNSLYFHFTGKHAGGGGYGTGFYEFQGQHGEFAQGIFGAFFDAQAGLTRRIEGQRRECSFNRLSAAAILEQKMKLTKAYVDQQLSALAG